MGVKRAIVLAGGKGTRLAPYTTVLPKPLMPIGDMPILEVLIRQLGKAGVCNITLAVGHLSSIMMAYFGDGAALGVDIVYSHEDQPLGTAGPLALVARPEETFMVMNGDLLTDLDFVAMAEAHERSGSAATIGLYRRDVKIDLGVIVTDAAGAVTEYIEKPVYSYLVSMGMYFFEPRVLDFIPAGSHFDLPDLIRALVTSGERVSSYLHEGFWLDIGRPDDYQRAQIEFETMRNRIL
jgi:NDP-sugar pyrophosphorylase family protein